MLQTERNKLVEENIGLVGQVIKDKVHGVTGIGLFTFDDLFQIGCMGLISAAEGFKPGKSCFSTFAYTSIRNAIFDALEYATLRRNRETVTDPCELPRGDAPEFMDSISSDLERALSGAQAEASGITAKGIAAIRLLAEGYSNKEIGERMGGATANNVTAWVARARKFLRARPDLAALGEPG